MAAKQAMNTERIWTQLVKDLNKAGYSDLDAATKERLWADFESVMQRRLKEKISLRRKSKAA